jgi:flavin reductase (DIM6/NTAB) family NADH-FMN oxidoreductase RutF
MPKPHLGRTTWLYPQPALLLAVRSGPDCATVMAVVWGGIASGNPPTVAGGIGAMQASYALICEAGDLTLNVPRSGQMAQADTFGTVSARQDPAKVRTCGWTLTPSLVISSPCIAECALNLECRVVERVQRATNATFLAEIVEAHVEEELLNAEGRADALRLGPLLWAPDGTYYRLGARLSREYEPGRALREGRGAATPAAGERGLAGPAGR